ncbi:MAG: ATP synthase F0 subunit C [Myxococcota bacterium]|nr:ATP synthase F0 subunit C [Myxococcota bacterium]
MNSVVKFLGTLVAGLLVCGVAQAAEGAASGGSSMMAIGLGLGIGLAVFGGALGQGKIGSAALEGIARNPSASDKVFVPMLLALAFVESLVLFGWVLMFLLQGKI